MDTAVTVWVCIVITAALVLSYKVGHRRGYRSALTWAQGLLKELPS